MDPYIVTIKQEVLSDGESSSLTNVFGSIVKQKPDNSSTDDEDEDFGLPCPQDKKEIIRTTDDEEEDFSLPRPKDKKQIIRKKIMRSQARELIATVYQHMKKEALHGVENLTDARWRTSQATGVSEKTVTRILKEKKKADETGSPIRSPHRNKKPRKCLRRDMENNDRHVIRETINAYKSEFNKNPSLSHLKRLLKEKIGFNGCIETLRRVLIQIGYEFVPGNSNWPRNKVLVDKFAT